MSTVQDASIEIPFGAAAEAIGDAVRTAAMNVGKAGQQIFCNANLRKAVENLFPDVKVQGPAVRITIPDGSEIVFEPSGSLYKATSSSGSGARVREAIGRVYQEYADLQLKEAAVHSGLDVLERRRDADGTLRIRLRARAGMSLQGEVTADVGLDGTARLETEKIEGPACEELLRPIAQALGSVHANRKKPAYSLGVVKDNQRSKARQKGS
jgi:hypothetical protein